MTAAIEINTAGRAQTDRLGRLLAELVCPGRVFCLQGPLGAGKSALARAIITASCDGADEIPSPTFTLVQPYQTRMGAELWHMDLYRLESVDDALALGIEDAFYHACCLIEWPERIVALLPDDVIRIEIAFGPQQDSRHFSLFGTETLLTPLLRQWAEQDS